MGSMTEMVEKRKAKVEPEKVTSAMEAVSLIKKEASQKVVQKLQTGIQTYPSSKNSIIKVYGQQDNQPRPECKTAKLNQKAVAWLAANRTALRAQGWTAQKLYQRHNFSRSVLFSRIWDKPGLEITTGTGGKIVFSFLSGSGQRIEQTDVPATVTASNQSTKE